MEDLNKKTLADLRGICAEEGLVAYGTKAVLIERIENAAAKSLKKVIVEEVKTPASTEHLQEETVNQKRNKVAGLIVEEIEKQNNIIIPSSTNRRAEIDSTIDEVNAFFAGRAECSYHKDSNMICFRGGPRIAWDVTPNQPMKSIMHFARAFVARADSRVETVGKVGGAF